MLFTDLQNSIDRLSKTIFLQVGYNIILERENVLYEGCKQSDRLLMGYKGLLMGYKGLLMNRLP